MSYLYSVTFAFSRPVRSNKTIEVVATSKQDVIENAYKAAEKLGILFGEYAYGKQPVQIQQLKELSN